MDGEAIKVERHPITDHGEVDALRAGAATYEKDPNTRKVTRRGVEHILRETDHERRAQHLCGHQFGQPVIRQLTDELPF